MNKPFSNTLIFASPILAVSTALVCIVAFQNGCSHITQRFQNAEEAMEFDEQIEKTSYISDVAAPIGLSKVTVDGIALVTQLDGTGSEPPPNEQRKYLVDEIKSHDINNINSLLSSKNNSMTLVMGDIPPGAREGDRFDLLVGSMPRTKTTSLEGGYMMRTRLKPFVNTGKSVEFGHKSGLAEGRVIVDSLFETGDKIKSLNGVILGGGIVIKSRENGLYLKPDHQTINNSTAVSRALNARFSTHVEDSPEGIANPVSDKRIEILVPEIYQHNIGRYFHVLLNIAFNETAAERVNRMEMLERDLHNPEKASLAAVRLEAIGDDAKSILKRGIRSSDPEIQFHAAQALAYMGDNSSAEILGNAAESEPAFRWHALTALACLKNNASESALVKLFDSKSAEARYGAFRTLRESIPDSPFIAGQNLGREFTLHSVASKAEPMIHISKSKVPEIVLFGNNQTFNPDFLYIESGTTIKAIANDQIEIKKYIRGKGEQKIVCSNLISDVLRNMVLIGADYGDAIKILKDARSTKGVDGRVVINALPSFNKSYRAVANRAAIAGKSEQSDRYVTEPVPAMFEDSGDSLRALTAEKPKSKGLFGKLNKNR